MKGSKIWSVNLKKYSTYLKIQICTRLRFLEHLKSSNRILDKKSFLNILTKYVLMHNQLI